MADRLFPRLHRHPRRRFARRGARHSLLRHQRRAVPATRCDLFATFGIIIITLVGQGSLLPVVARLLGLPGESKKERAHQIREELAARRKALAVVGARLDKAIEDHELPEEMARHLRTRNEVREQVLPANLEDGLESTRLTAKVKKELIETERQFIFDMLREGKISDDARRRIEYELDLEEASVANRAKDGGGWF